MGKEAELAREHNNANVIGLSGRFTDLLDTSSVAATCKLGAQEGVHNSLVKSLIDYFFSLGASVDNPPAERIKVRRKHKYTELAGRGGACL